MTSQLNGIKRINTDDDSNESMPFPAEFPEEILPETSCRTGAPPRPASLRLRNRFSERERSNRAGDQRSRSGRLGHAFPGAVLSATRSPQGARTDCASLTATEGNYREQNYGEENCF